MFNSKLDAAQVNYLMSQFNDAGDEALLSDKRDTLTKKVYFMPSQWYLTDDNIPTPSDAFAIYVLNVFNASLIMYSATALQYHSGE